MKKILFLLFITSCMLFSSCELILFHYAQKQPEFDYIEESINASLIPKKENSTYNLPSDTKNVSYKESYKTNDKIILDIQGSLDSSSYKTAEIRIKYNWSDHTREPFLAWNHKQLGECLGTMNLALYQEGPQSSRLFDLNSDLLVNSYITDSW